MTQDSNSAKGDANDATRSGNRVFKSPTRSSSHYRRRDTPHFSRKTFPNIKQYNLRGRLGEGAFGRCYAAKSNVSGRYYALKVISFLGDKTRAKAH
jgi:hypothetical protein